MAPLEHTGDDRNRVTRAERGVVDLATYPVQRPWNVYDVIGRFMPGFENVDDLDSTEAAQVADMLVGLVKLAKSHEWFVDSPSDNGPSWRIRAGSAKTCDPFKPIGRRQLYYATYRKCYDVNEDSFTYCCMNRCSRRVIRPWGNRESRRREGTIVMDEKCKFCFPREHSTKCKANIACRCACLAYNYDMMWTPIGEGTFEYRSAHNRMMSFVDSTSGCLIMPLDIVDVLVNMGFATVGAHSSLFLSAKETTYSSQQVYDRTFALAAAADINDDDNDEDDDDEEEEDESTIANPAITADNNNNNNNNNNNVVIATGTASPSSRRWDTHVPSFTTTATEKYVNVMIRCCACLFTISLKNIDDWEKLNFSHGAHCPPCAFVRQPVAKNADVVTVLELSYRKLFANIHALTYSECLACACRYIAPSFMFGGYHGVYA